MHIITILVLLASVMVAYWVGTLHGHARCGRKFRAEMLEQQRGRPMQRQVAA